MPKLMSDDAVAVLAESTATDTELALPGRQLDRKLYDEVNKALVALGGTWNRRQRVHVFTRDPRPGLELLFATGEMPDNADKLASWWPTPPGIAKHVVKELLDGDWPLTGRVLEPSAGEGALADVVRALAPAATLRAVEPDEHRAQVLIGKGHAVTCETFERFCSFHSRDRADLYDAIVMNPPFTTPGDRMAWLTHVELALTLLAPGGRLAAILPRSIERGDRARVRLLRAHAEQHGFIASLPDDAFKPVGTGVRTSLFVVDQREPYAPV